jgi:hypothetical protein
VTETAPVLRYLALGILGATVLVPAACRVDRAQFDERVFSCDTAAPDPGCGTDDAGKALGCFSARQIGATDFCAPTCDVAAPPAAGDVCLDSGIALHACTPSTGVCDQAGLACYRTDLLTDEGVCTTMNPCNVDTDCHDPVLSVCATTFLASVYAQAPDLQRDHLYCLQTGCNSSGTSCSPGETCLQEVIPASAHPPDICVPNCDSNLNCPPNFLCYRKVATPQAPNVCIPGLLGFTCENALDCMLGQCVPNGIGYSICTTDCAADSDCARFDGQQGTFLCAVNNGDPTTPGKCQTPDSYRGTICLTDGDCAMRNLDEKCSRFDPSDVTGTCLLPCTPDPTSLAPGAPGKCPQRGGINHTCLTYQDEPALVKDPQFPPVCFPGYFGLTCQTDANCVGDLTCAPVSATASICTAPCQVDAACAADRWVGGGGWCGAPLGLDVCLPNNTLDDASPCPSDVACKSGMCLKGVCAPTGGGA